MTARPRIGDYAAIGDTRTVALVGRDGSIDWWCPPRFDAAAVFLRLLDEDRGGAFRIGPMEARFDSQRRYLPGTNVLETTFRSEAGDGQMIDWMPWDRTRPVAGASVIVRDVRGLSGACGLALFFRPTFDFAREAAVLHAFDGGVVAVARSGTIALFAPDTRLGIAGDRADAAFVVRAGESVRIVAAFASAPEDAIRAAGELHGTSLEPTIESWRGWSSRCGYDGPYREAVIRSALVLKLMTFADTGALVAAPTTSLPEQVGGVRNWDYRYAWLRDASLALYALMALDLHDEALRFWDWIERLGRQWERGAPIRIMYTLDGAAVPTEVPLDHLAGFAGSRPVRVGNGACDQRQHDVLGEVIRAAHSCHAAMRWQRPELLSVLARLADLAAASWRDPDAGLWEMRGRPAHHLNSKLFCWVALDRALRMAQTAGLHGDTARWRREADAIREAILGQGYSLTLRAFTQTLGGETLDASALRIPLVGFLPATDPRVISTVERIEHDLTHEGLVLRYAMDDGLPGVEGTFALCSLWMANVLSRMGRTRAARTYLERVLGAANDVGLLAEEIDRRSGELLGNFPQAFTHLGVIEAAVALREAESSGPRHLGR